VVSFYFLWRFSAVLVKYMEDGWAMAERHGIEVIEPFG